jgi:predicted permease
MVVFIRIRKGFRALFRKTRLEQELDAELRAFFEAAIEEKMRTGMSRQAATRLARLEQGSMESVKDRVRDVGWESAVEGIWQDVRYAGRTLRRSPSFAAVAILTLALGIAGATAMFSVINAIVLRSLPYDQPDRLVRIVENVPAEESFDGKPQRITSIRLEEFLDWRAASHTLAFMAVYSTASATLTSDRETVRVIGTRVSPAIFQMLGSDALVGRVFDSTMESPSAPLAVVLSYRIWQQQFSSASTVIGRTVVLDGKGHLVLGIMRPEFAFPDNRTDFWVPLVPPEPHPGVITHAQMIARLKDGVPLEDAVAEANVLGGRSRNVHPQERPTVPSQRFEVIPVKDELVARVRPVLIALAVAGWCMLAIACCNVANLLLVRASTRAHELAVRRSLGASSHRLASQAVIESTFLAMVGGSIGAVIACAAIPLLGRLAVINAPDWLAVGSGGILPRLEELNVDRAVLGFAALTALVTGLLFSLAPVLSVYLEDVWRLDGNVRGWTRYGYAPFVRARGRTIFVILELALTTTLLLGAGFVIQHFIRLSQVHPGYDPKNVLTFQLILPQGRHSSSARQQIAEELVTRLNAEPRIQAVGFTNILPLAPVRWSVAFQIPSVSLDVLRRDGSPQTRYVSRDYLRAMGVRLLKGRWFKETDGYGQPRVILINRALEERYFQRRSAVGTFVTLSKEPAEIVGVIDNVRQGRLDGEPDPQYFIDLRQLPDHIPLFPDLGGPYFAVRTQSDTTDIVPLLRTTVRLLDSQGVLDNIFEMEQLVSMSIARPRLYSVLLGAFSSAAVLLSLVGIYGIVAYSVRQRTREFGIRMAVGAQDWQVVLLVLRQCGQITIYGILLGVAGAVAATEYLGVRLGGPEPNDSLVWICLPILFCLVATAACYVPVRNAVRADPLTSLRCD